MVALALSLIAALGPPAPEPVAMTGERFIISMIKLLLFFGLLALVFAAFYGSYRILSLPLRRRDRAWLFLDLLENGLQNGLSPEQTVVTLSNQQERGLGLKFYLLAAHVENGMTLGQALQRVPRFLPRPCAATLRAGEELGDIRKVIPASRQWLDDAGSRVTSGNNFLAILFMMLNPFGGGVWPFLWIVIVPKFHEIFIDLLDGADMPPLWHFVETHGRSVVVLQSGLSLLFIVSVVMYATSGRLPGAAGKWLTDQLRWLIPWKRKRLIRGFSSMLASGLDAGVPESAAVRIAAASTDNGVVNNLAATIITHLKQGYPLPATVARCDSTNEFGWRLANAARNRSGFLQALNGWHDSLAARAYQQEQTASQLVTTGLVLVNGLAIGLIATGMFQVLSTVVTQLSLW